MKRPRVLRRLFATLSVLTAAACVAAVIGAPHIVDVQTRAQAVARAHELLDSPLVHALDPEGHAEVADILDEVNAPGHDAISALDLEIAVPNHETTARQTGLFAALALFLLCCANVGAFVIAGRRPDKKQWGLVGALALSVSVIVETFASREPHISARVAHELFLLTQVTVITCLVVRRMTPSFILDGVADPPAASDPAVRRDAA